MDPYHNRASVYDPGDDALVFAPGQVFENFHEALARIDLDPTQPLAVNEIASVDEMIGLFQLGLAPELIADITNESLRLMEARYPPPAVRHPYPTPPEFDLRQKFSLAINDVNYLAALRIFNRRSAQTGQNLTPDDARSDLDHLDPDEHPGSDYVQIVIALVVLYAYKVNALAEATKRQPG